MKIDDFMADGSFEYAVEQEEQPKVLSAEERAALEKVLENDRESHASEKGPLNATL